MARLVAVPISLQFWQEMCTQGWRVGYNGHVVECVKGLPEGAELVNSYYDGKHQTAYLVFHHPSFSDVPVGGEIPRFDPVLQDTRIDEWMPGG